MGRKNPVDFLSVKILFVFGVIAVFAGIVIGFQPRIFEFSADHPFYIENDPKPVKVNWQVSFFSTDITLESPDQKYQVEPSGQMAFYPSAPGKYLLTSSNLLSRLFGIQHAKWIDIDVQSVAFSDSPDFMLSTSKQAVNTYEIAWKIDQGLENPVLKIGDETFPIDPTQLTGKKNVDIKEDTIVILSCNHKNREQRKTTNLSFEGKDFKIRRFVVWLPTTGQVKNAGTSPSYGVKFAELVATETSEGYKVVKSIPVQQLNPGESVLVEWDVEGADSLLIEPISKEVLPKKGASTLILNQSTNVILNAVADGKKITYTIPLSVTQPLLKTKTPTPTTIRYYGSGSVRTAVPSSTSLSIPKPKAPIIEFFRVNPNTFKEPGKIILSWSVSGDWTRIQLLTSQLISTGLGHAEQVLAQTNTTTVTENLPPSGFLVFDVRGGTSFILRAWNGSSVDSASADIRMDEPAVRKAQTVTNIQELFPIATMYSIGEEVTVSVQVSDVATGALISTGSVIVTDGISYCQISLPKGSCDLLIRQDGQYDIEAFYYGTTTYMASEDRRSIQSGVKPKENTIIKANFLPDSRSFYLKDEYIVSVDLSSISGMRFEAAPTGTFFISDGFENCLLTLPRNSCSFTPKIAGDRAITITYSGDKNYAGSTLVTPVTITDKPLELNSITLEILSLFPAKESYTIGDSVDVYVKVNGSLPSLLPTGKIEVSDGYATCSISFTSENHCSLRLISADASNLMASYPGDEQYLQANAVPLPIQVDAQPKKVAIVSISQVLPMEPVYKVGDQLDVTVVVSDEENEQTISEGVVTVSDGFTSCEIVLAERSSCRLTLTNGTAKSLTAVYSGSDMYTSATSAPYSIELVMTMLTASLQPLIYQDCQTYAVDPSNEIQIYTDFNQTPPLDGFFLDDRFTIGNGFVINAQVESQVGNFPPEVGTVQATLCSNEDPSYCYSSDPQPMTRDSNQFTAASASIEIPPLDIGGNYQLTLRFDGDGESFGSNQRIFSVFNLRPGKLVLNPSGIFMPDSSFTSYFWSELDATDLRAANYDFDAYILLGGLPQCPVPISPSSYPQPSSTSMHVSVDPTMPGSDRTDSEWKSAFVAQGYNQTLVDRLQPNQMVWTSDSCIWSAGSDTWRLSCREVGINEPSVIRYSLEQTDKNYAVVEGDGDGISDIPIVVSINRYLSGLQIPSALSSVQQGAPYWLNNSGASFGYWVVDQCPEEYLRGNFTMSNSIPAAQSVRLIPFALTRSHASSDYRFQEAEGTVHLSSPSNSTMLNFLPEYHGICSSCQPAGMMQFPSIVNRGCSLSNGNEISITGANGTLYGGNRCEMTEYGTEMVQSSFCQVSFEGSGELLVRFDGNDQLLPSEVSQTVSIVGARLDILRSFMESPESLSMVSEETPSAEIQQNLMIETLIPFEEILQEETILPTSTPESVITLEPDAGLDLDNSQSGAQSAAPSASSEYDFSSELLTLETNLVEPEQLLELSFDGFRTTDGIYEIPNHFPLGTQAAVHFTINPYLPAGDLSAIMSVSQDGESLACSSSGNEVLCPVQSVCDSASGLICTGYHQLLVNFYGSGGEHPSETVIIEFLVEPASMGISFPEEALQTIENLQLLIQEANAQVSAIPAEVPLELTVADFDVVFPIAFTLDAAVSHFVNPDDFALEIELETSLHLNPIEIPFDSFDAATQQVTFTFNLPDILNSVGYSDFSQAMIEITGIRRITAYYSVDDAILPASAEILLN